jgi:23S rRNA pseudouridine1911/1915/1917 synthase
VSVVVFSSPELLILNKPPGLSLATRRSAPGDVEERLRKLLASEALALGPGPLFLVHRLDVGTTGLVLVARNAATLRLLSQALSQGEIHRSYLALVWGKPRPQEGVWESGLSPDPRDRRKMRVDPAGKKAVTAYRRLAHVPPVSLLLLQPRTGRTHQIRVHLSAAGHPIVGDDLYGGPRHRGVKDPELRRLLAPSHPLLHAWRLQLPEGMTPSVVTAPLPEEFRAVLEALGLSQVVEELAAWAEESASASSAAKASHERP